MRSCERASDACCLWHGRPRIEEYVAQHADHRDEAGHGLVLRNGVAESRKLSIQDAVHLASLSRVNEITFGR
jgi:hypothetical protein